MPLTIQEPLTTQLERTIQRMIQHKFDDDFPVFRSAQTPTSEDIECVIITASKEEDPELVNEGTTTPLETFSIEIQLWSLAATEDEDATHLRLFQIEQAMKGTDLPADLDLTAYSYLNIPPGFSTTTEIDQESGRRTRTYGYTANAQRATS